MLTSSLLGIVLIIAGLVQPPARESPPAQQAAPSVRADASLAPEARVALFAAARKAASEHVQLAPRSSLATTSQVKTVCGLRVYPVDPTLDPGIIRATPPDTGQYKIRRIEPPACSE